MYIYISHMHNWGILSYYGHYSFPKPVPTRLPRPESDDPELQSLPVPCGGVGYMEDLLGISWDMVFNTNLIWFLRLSFITWCIPRNGEMLIKQWIWAPLSEKPIGWSRITKSQTASNVLWVGFTAGFSSWNGRGMLQGRLGLQYVRITGDSQTSS